MEPNEFEKQAQVERVLEVELPPGPKPEILKLNGIAKRQALPHIALKVLQLVYPAAPTASNLQLLCQMRKRTFLKVLKHLLGTGLVVRTGNGRKHSPHRYRLRED
jgi:hypothetical protein